MNIVKIISTSFDSLGRLLPKFQRMGLSDIQETVSSAPYGIDSNPVKDMIAVYAPTSVSGEALVIGYINKDCLTDVGETRVFSTNENGQLQTYIHLKNNGDIHFGGDAKNLVRFQELESGFNQLKTDLNTFINLYNLHVHVTPSGTSSATVSLATASTASIAGAKIDEFKSL